VRKLGIARGLKINEYGVSRGTRRIAGASEKSVFDQVSLPFIAPELREDRGEIEAGAAGRLPKLGTDAHSTDGLRFMRYGAGQARRGWLEAGDVLNTRSWPELRKLLKRA
jgi:hypothetical protein